MASFENATVLHAVGLTKTYGDVNVVDGLDMSVCAGDIYGFVGRNGAGKSTTMKMICGLISANSGELSVLSNGSAASGGATGVGALIEAPGLLDKMNSLDNLMYKATALGVKNAKEESIALLKLVGLENTGSKNAGDFSLGMKQRLGIALAMVGSPKLLLLDEPFNGLDPAATQEMRQTLQRLNRERELTIVVSSHVLDQLNRFANRFGVINAGKMVIEFDSEHMKEMAAGVIRVKCTNTEKARSVLSEAFPSINLGTAPDGAITVPGHTVEVEQVSLALFQNNLQILELVQTKRDVEDFFLELMSKQAGQATAPADSNDAEGGR